MIHIRDILKPALNQYRPTKDMEMIKIWDIWDNFFDQQEINSNAQPDSFRAGTLIINVSNSAWLHQLKFMEQEIIVNINKLLNNIKVEKLRFRIKKI